jgi:hypothetical protein
MPFIVDYIIKVLVNYTKFKENGDLNLREYINEVFIKIVDVYGFINVYYPLLELLYNNYFSLNSEKMNLYNKISNLFKDYLYKPRIKPYDMNEIFDILNDIGKLIHNINFENKKLTILSSPLTSGIRTQKMRTSKTALFDRKPLIKRFKNPLFLSLK